MQRGVFLNLAFVSIRKARPIQACKILHCPPGASAYVLLRRDEQLLVFRPANCQSFSVGWSNSTRHRSVRTVTNTCGPK